MVPRLNARLLAVNSSDSMNGDIFALVRTDTWIAKIMSQQNNAHAAP